MALPPEYLKWKAIAVKLYAHEDLTEEEVRLVEEADASRRTEPPRGFDGLAARRFDNVGNIASGLTLDEIGEDGHAVANKLWKIAAYLKRRNW